MRAMFQIHMLPAAHGDCLLVEYGSNHDVHRMLIDGGVSSTYNTLRAKLLSIPEKQRRLDLAVISHVDADHIEGIVKLLGDDALNLSIREIWFNGLTHLDDRLPLSFGGVQGEYASALIEKRKIPWNQANEGQAIHVPDEGPLPCFTLPGGMRLTILSPTLEKMHTMADKWEAEVKKAGLVPGHPKEALEHMAIKSKRLMCFSEGSDEPDVEALVREPYERDDAPANGSSIAFLAEYEGKSVLFGADAHAEVLVETITRLLKTRQLDVLPLDIFKLPHHGSSANLSPELVKLIQAKQVLVSTSGAIFEHPDAEAIARIVHSRRDIDLIFNYRSEETAVWDCEKVRQQFGFSTQYPRENGQIVSLDLTSQALDPK